MLKHITQLLLLTDRKVPDCSLQLHVHYNCMFIDNIHVLQVEQRCTNNSALIL